MTERDYFVHPSALCETTNVGTGSRVWAFAHILPGARIGQECNICDGVFIENDVVVGDRVTVKCGVQLWDGVRLGDDVFVGPNATFTNDPFPRSRVYPGQFAQTIVAAGASIGANATILPGVRIGAGAMIGAGAVVTRDVASGTVVVGNPAREIDHKRAKRTDREDRKWPTLGECRIIELTRFEDARGSLVPIESGRDLPFLPKRLFAIADVATGASRGAHANLKSDQFILPVRGGLTVRVSDGADEGVFVLDRPDAGLLVPAGIWNDLYDFLPETNVVVLASDHYDEHAYIRNMDEFSIFRKGARP